MHLNCAQRLPKLLPHPVYAMIALPVRLLRLWLEVKPTRRLQKG